jgi:lysyl-tRNA synthetase class 2
MLEAAARTTRPQRSSSSLLTENVRYSKRCLDYLVNPDSVAVIKLRSKVEFDQLQVISFVRKFLEKRNFMEVETPILALASGGANARPFQTFSLAEKKLFQLRVSPELHLKQLVIGGFHKIFEIGKQFRNEGIDATHTPEFTSCELYEAFASVDEMIALTEVFFRGLMP